MAAGQGEEPTEVSELDFTWRPSHDWAWGLLAGADMEGQVERRPNDGRARLVK